MALNLNAINQNSQYNRSKPKINLEWSSLQMRQSNPTTGLVGKLIPFFHKEMIPGEKVEISHTAGIQFNQFVSSVYQELFGQFITYFVPMRLIYDNWEEFITGGENGEYDQSLDTLTYDDLCASGLLVDTDPGNDVRYGAIFKDVTDPSSGLYLRDDPDWTTPDSNSPNNIPVHPVIGSCLDYMGLPILDLFGANINGQYVALKWKKAGPYDVGDAAAPYFEGEEGINLNAGPIKAYNLIWNEVLRYPDISPKRKLKDCSTQYWYWPNDYFTRARVYQQRGIAPLIPVEGQGSITGNPTIDVKTDLVSTSSAGGSTTITISKNDTLQGVGDAILINQGGVPQASIQSEATLSSTQLSYDGATVSLNDFSYALMISRYQYNNAKILPRYIDHLRDRFGVDPQDYRLQLPEYIHSSTFGVDINSVTQTSAATGDSPQGNITSQGQALTSNNRYSYVAKEHGYLITLCCIRPQAVYANGISPLWLHRNRFDFPTPELYNSIDVPISKTELFYSIVGRVNTNSFPTQNKIVFGYKGIYDEYRTMTNKVTGLLRPNSALATLKSYTLSRNWELLTLAGGDTFSSPEINLNEDFMLCRPDMQRIIAFQDQPDFTAFFDTTVNCAIPIPYESQPLKFAEV